MLLHMWLHIPGAVELVGWWFDEDQLWSWDFICQAVECGWGFLGLLAGKEIHSSSF